VLVAESQVDGRERALVECAAPSLFPPHVSCVAVRFPASPPASALAVLPRELADARPERQAAYLAGRHCAVRALDALGLPPFAPPYDGPNRPPVWPAAAVGSITHTGSYAAAAVARAENAVAIGLDAEGLVSDRRARGVATLVAHHEEMDVARRAGLSLGEALTVLFSIKEAAFKCVYPIGRTYFGYLDAKVECPARRRGSGAGGTASD